VELGTIIIAGNIQPKNSGQISRSNGTRNPSTLSTTSYPIAFWDLLGHSVLQRTIERLRRFGVQLISVFNNEESVASISHGEAWEKAVLDHARNGVERILLITLGAYTELDVDDLMRFHLAHDCRVTNVSDGQEPLGITLMESKCVADHGTPLRNRLTALVSCSCNYEYTGFANRLASPADYRQLVQDALAGRCQIQPIGKEIQPGIWIADYARIPRSVRVLGPCYIGTRTRIRPGCLIAPGTALERQCEIDCGTVVENSTILPSTYLGPGLHVSNSLISGSRLVHLGRRLDVELGDTGLLGWTQNPASLRMLAALSSLFAFGGAPGVRVPTPSRAPASLDYIRSNGFFS
jgi:hypothetical protein